MLDFPLTDGITEKRNYTELVRDLVVGAQRVRGGEELVAEVTGELAAHVGLGVLDQILALGEGFGAGLTLVTLLIS